MFICNFPNKEQTKRMNQKFDTVDAYIESFPEKTKKLLVQIRKTVKKHAPAAEETIAYGMPAYKLNRKPLVYFAAFAHHIGFYATPNGHKHFADRLAGYKQGKGSVQFPLDGPIPLDLIADIVQFKAEENLKKTNKLL